MNKLTEVSLKNGYRATYNHYCKLIYSLSLILLIYFLTSSAQAKYSGGKGEPNNPYQIADANDLNEIGLHDEDWDSHFIMVNDINLAGYTGTQFNIIGHWIWWNDPSNKPFSGVFDGNGFAISNFTYESDDIDRFGLLACVYGPNTIVKDLTLIDPNVRADYIVGSLVGFLIEGTICNCGVRDGQVSGGWYTGGLVGNNWDGTISNCYATTYVLGNDGTGGLVGGNDYGGVISNCYATGNVSGNSWYTGGLVGWNINGTISNCYAIGSVSGDWGTGGLAGYNDECWGVISDCYATGSVLGTGEQTGGLVGDNFGTISNCYATGAIEGGDATGGFVGVNDNTILASFWDKDTSGQSDGVGGGWPGGVTGKTTAEMQTRSTFTDAGWDLVGTWNIEELQTYPLLRKYLAVDLNYDHQIDFIDFAIFADHWLAGVE